MASGEHTPGRRIRESSRDEQGKPWYPWPEPGDYWFDESHGHWSARPPGTPDDAWGNLSAHTVTEHEDGTITVSPSILLSGGSTDFVWHGYLEAGVWREV